VSVFRKTTSAAVLAALFFLAGCGGGAGGCSFGVGRDAANASQGSEPRIVLNVDAPRPTIDIVGVPDNVLVELGTLDSREAWVTVFKVAVGPDQLATVGQYSIEGDRVRFTPMFPLDRGRQYHVTFTAPGGAKPVTGTVALPPIDTTPTTVVTQVYPTADVVPENQLRLYIHFSAPMGSQGGLDFVHLLDESGQEVKDPFLPLDAEFFNEDRTRYTVFFDPGRQKRGIAPVDQMGRSLTEGKYYTLVIDAPWRDGKGLPLKESFRRKFKVGPPDERPLDPKTWKIQPPAAGSDAPLVVAFPEPLDHGLLLRALGVVGPNKKALEGAVKIGPQETSWTFTPAEPWKAGEHYVLALAMLEDLAGNRIGRAFEVDNFDRTDQANEPERTLIPFTIR
jgi:hypothetical protein